jgi:hypothetical protein
MQTRKWDILIALMWLIATPVTAFAQASITGVVKDTSGAVLPGVTVEAASPALIEKVRTVVSDGAGQYRIVDLRPGTYTVSFTLPGFATVRHGGIELAGTFVATVNAELRVGALEETITVSGETPVVDVQSARQEQIVSHDVIASIPSSRAFLGLVALNPTVVLSAQDVGGTTGPVSTRFMSHGSVATDSRMMVNGLLVSSADGGGASGSYYVPQVTASQEVVTTSAGGLGEAETSGVIVNTISREGGNRTSGVLFGTGTTPGLQSNNYTQALKDQGLKASDRIARNWDFTPALGGPILRDKLWYFAYGRSMVADNYVAGMFYNKNAGNPNAWTYDPDPARQAIQDGAWRSAAARLTWQATPRNKFSIMWDEQRRCVGCPGATATQSPEAGAVGLSFNDRVSQASWTSPYTNRLLFEAAFGTHILSWGGGLGDLAPERLIPVNEQAGVIPGLTYRGISGNYRRGNATYNSRASVSYVSGAHNVKVGYWGSFYDYRAEPYSLNGGLRYRFNNGVPNQVTQTVEDFTWEAYLLSDAMYVQDQWTVRRLTLQGGLRYDLWKSSFPDQQLGPTALVPAPIVLPAETGSKFHDVTPRLSATYDLFGDGKTAVKINLGKYMVAQESSSSGTFGSFMNPINRMATSTTRSWNDLNRDFVANCNLTIPAANGECGPMANQNFGKNVYSVTYDPNVISGWGVRPYSWEFGASVQREIVPRVSATVGYFRLWFDNVPVTHNLDTTASDYTFFNLPVPVDLRLPNSGGVLTVPTINPDKFGQVHQQVTAGSNYGTIVQRWTGVDFTVNARLPNGLTAQGGLNTGRFLFDDCEVATKLPEILFGSNISNAATTNPSTAWTPLEYCRAEPTYRTQIKGFAAYTIPRVDVQVSGTWQNIPGPAIQANYVVPNSVIAPLLGRNLAGGAANQTVSLLNVITRPQGGGTQPVSMDGDRLNQVDLRVAKLLRFGRTRTLVGVDIFNALNSNAVRNQNSTYGPAWLTPTEILQARFAKVSAQIDF